MTPEHSFSFQGPFAEIRGTLSRPGKVWFVHHSPGMFSQLDNGFKSRRELRDHLLRLKLFCLGLSSLPSISILHPSQTKKRLKPVPSKFKGQVYEVMEQLAKEFWGDPLPPTVKYKIFLDS